MMNPRLSFLYVHNIQLSHIHQLGLGWQNIDGLMSCLFAYVNQYEGYLVYLTTTGTVSVYPGTWQTFPAASTVCATELNISWRTTTYSQLENRSSKLRPELEGFHSGLNGQRDGTDVLPLRRRHTYKHSEIMNDKSDVQPKWDIIKCNDITSVKC